MATRKIIEINRDLCDGCGLCTTACAEGALVLDEDNKAKLEREIYCDGLGACLDVCPTGALKIIERKSKEYDAQATYQHILKTRGAEAAEHVHGADPGTDAPASRPSFSMGCPGSQACEIPRTPAPPVDQVSGRSELSQWPIQLHLISPHAPYFNHSDLLIAADCTAFTLGSFHQDMLKGKKLIIACPKLDDTTPYIEKLTELLKSNTIYSLTVARMVVPCCSGLIHIIQEAIERSGSRIPLKEIVVGIDGQIMNPAA
jgi:ferredoxin